MRRDVLVVLGVLIALAAAGCFPTIDEAVREHRKPVEPRLETLREIGEELAKQPLLASDTLAAAPKDMVLDLTYQPGSDANTALLYLEDLADLGAIGNVYARLPNSTVVSDCAAFVAHETYAWDPAHPERWQRELAGDDVADDLELCARLRYVLVIRTTELVRASDARLETWKSGAPAERTELDSYGDPACETEGRCKFDGGRIVAEVHLFQLDPRDHEGGLRLTADSSEKIELTGMASEAMELDLTRSVAKALEQALAGAEIRGPF